MAQPNPLRALIQRLTSTPVEELPSIAYFLASSISRCLVVPQAPGIDRTALLQKLKARVSSLLQDRTPEGRLTAVIVAKAVLEAGGREILVDSESWIRGLIGILNKSDPAATKKLATVTIARAFFLTQDYPSIVREITTPLLPSFNIACLAAIRPKTRKTEQGLQNVLSPLLSTVLQCWIELLPQHPATFRPFVTRFRPICLSLLSDAATPASISELAEALLVALPHSAPKNTAAAEWSQLQQDTIRAAHATATNLFRSVREEWTPAETDVNQHQDELSLDGDLPGGGPDVFGLAAWKGMHDGAQRLSILLSLLEASMSVSSAVEVAIPLGDLMDLCTRMLYLTIPGVGKDSPYTLKNNSEFGKDERDMLWAVIPAVHVSCLKMLYVAVDVLQQAILPISKPLLDQLTWLFGAEQDLPDVRISSYELLELLLRIMGGLESDIEVRNVSGIIRHACKDLLPTVKDLENIADRDKGSKRALLNVDSFAGQPRKNVGSPSSSIYSASQLAPGNLISTFLQYVPAHLIPRSLRTEVDRTVILTQQSRALLASVLNPAIAQQGQQVPASLLPFLAHTSASLEMEALLRPRMPVISIEVLTGMDVQADTVGSDAGSDIDMPLDQAGSGLLDRLRQAMAPANPHKLTEASRQDENKGLRPVAGDAVPEGDDRTLLSTKRDFAAMNGNGTNGWHASGFSETRSAIFDGKKARLDHETLVTPSFVDVGLDDAQTPLNGHSTVDVIPTNSVSMLQEQETKIGNQPMVEAEAQPIIESLSTGKALALEADDSDSDIPEINIEPDTDEDEEDDDMYD